MKMEKRLTKEDKISFIIKNELMITEAILRGHKASDNDEFAEIRSQIKKYRKQLDL